MNMKKEEIFNGQQLDFNSSGVLRGVTYTDLVIVSDHLYLSCFPVYSSKVIPFPTHPLHTDDITLVPGTLH